MSDRPEVVGVCPACGWHSLFLAEGGFVTCNRADCRAPETASDLLSLKASAVRLVVEAMPLAVRAPLDREEMFAALREYREQPMISIPGSSALSPGQLRLAADALRRRYGPPSPSMMSSDYLVHQGIRALAQALDEVAAEQGGHG